MSKLRIFIEGLELDTLDSVTVPITRQFEELSDPTVICNDYSKTVTVPLSKNNNAIFGHCYNPDRLIVAGGEDTPLVGIYFDPYKKLECRLQWDDDVFFTGYAKMLKVTEKGYEVTINGELGKIFQELQKITFDKSKYEDEEYVAKYWIDGSKYVNAEINKELVYNCWNSTHDDNTLREVTDSDYDITDIIGFVPNNSYSDGFDYKNYEYVDYDDGNSLKTKSFADLFQSAGWGDDGAKTFEEASGVSADSVIGDGFLPAQFNEWRSCLQIPFIYWDMFWQIFAKKGKELTGYEWEFSDGWDRSNNKNYNGIGVTLLQRDAIDFESDAKVDNAFSMSINADDYSATAGGSAVISTTQTKGSEVDGYNVRFSIAPSFFIKLKGTNATNSVGFNYYQMASTYAYYYGGIIVNYRYTDSNGTTTFLRVGFCSSRTREGEKTLGNAMYWFKHWFTDCDAYVGVDNVTTPSSGVVYDFIFGTDETMYGNVTTKGSGGVVSIEVEYLFFSETSATASTKSSPFAYFDGSSVTSIHDFTTAATEVTISPSYYLTNFRSGDSFTLNDICRLDFSNILDYCKRFRINIVVDELEKKIKFSRSLFANSTIVDKTGKIDASTFDIAPITFESKYVDFGYKSVNTKLGVAYRNAIGLAYGAKRLTTAYNFDTRQNTLFEKTTETLLYSPSCLIYGFLMQKNPVVSFFCYSNNYLECRDSDGKTIDVSGAYFYPTKKKIDTYYTHLISDDSPSMALRDTYCYQTHMLYSLHTDYWTSPELVMADPLILPTIYYTCLWTLPKKNYTAQADYFSRLRGGIFESFWQTYLSERYNTQNKKVTTYVRLSPSDFINFDFSQFWKIGNQLYIVNKIYDYDITSDKYTKVDLITVQDINAYK